MVATKLNYFQGLFSLYATLMNSKKCKTRLHSSRMHTARLLIVSPSMHCAEWGCLLRGSLLLGVVCSGGGRCLLWGVSAPGGVCSRGMSAPGGMWYSSYTEADTPLWTEFLTHATENITLPQTSFAGGNNAFYLLPQMYSCPLCSCITFTHRPPTAIRTAHFGR